MGKIRIHIRAFDFYTSEGRIIGSRGNRYYLVFIGNYGYGSWVCKFRHNEIRTGSWHYYETNIGTTVTSWILSLAGISEDTLWIKLLESVLLQFLHRTVGTESELTCMANDLIAVTDRIKQKKSLYIREGSKGNSNSKASALYLESLSALKQLAESSICFINDTRSINW